MDPNIPDTDIPADKRDNPGEVFDDDFVWDPSDDFETIGDYYGD